jgi:XTP/dITP diphosphohydrolase
MLEILVGTGNRGKIAEYAELLPELGVRFMGLADIGLAGLEVAETGTTFAENSALKARSYAQASGRLTVADDSGLEVDALGGEPGIRSARYGGAGLDDAGRRAYLLRQLGQVPAEGRGARFTCVISLAWPDRETLIQVSGHCRGSILMAERDGGYGFGYDALFVPEGESRTFAELPAADKHAISHRGRATRQLAPYLADLLAQGG